MKHDAAPRHHAGVGGAGQVTHLHRLKLLPEVHHRHPEGQKAAAVFT